MLFSKSLRYPNSCYPFCSVIVLKYNLNQHCTKVLGSWRGPLPPRGPREAEASPSLMPPRPNSRILKQRLGALYPNNSIPFLVQKCKEASRPPFVLRSNLVRDHLSSLKKKGGECYVNAFTSLAAVICLEAFASIKRFDHSSREEWRIPKAIALAITL